MTNKLHKVQSGDTLSKIIIKYYGKINDENLKLVMDANGIKNPSLISVGQQIKLPGNWAGDSPTPLPVAKKISPTVVQSDICMLDPDFRAKVVKTMADAKKAGLKVKIYETGRIDARQRYLFGKGYSKIKTVGMHGHGGAVDIVFVRAKGESPWDEPNEGDWDKLWAIARKNGMYTVGTWDRAHFQAVPVSGQSKWYKAHQDLHKRING